MLRLEPLVLSDAVLTVEKDAGRMKWSRDR